MNVFDIIGPVMVGPSSSHTAGAVRLGRIARKLLGEQPREAVISFHGSFAHTYRGHGTDKAIIAGLLDMGTDDTRIRKSLDMAREAGLEYCFQTVELKDAHPNTAVIKLIGVTEKRVEVTGWSVGGGNVVIKKINGMSVDFTGQFFTLVVMHKDSPGAVAAVTNKLSLNQINIAQMRVFRSRKRGDAVMIIETDQAVPCTIEEELAALAGINRVSVIEPVS